MKKIVSIILISGMILCLLSGIAFAGEYDEASSEASEKRIADEMELNEMQDDSFTDILTEEEDLLVLEENALQDEETDIELQASPTLDAEIFSLGVFYSFIEWKISWTGKTDDSSRAYIYLKIESTDGTVTVYDNKSYFNLANYGEDGSTVFIYNGLDYNNNGFKDGDKVYWKLSLADSYNDTIYDTAEGEFALVPVSVKLYGNGHGLDYTGTVRFGDYLSSGKFTDPDGNEISYTDIPKTDGKYVLCGWANQPIGLSEYSAETRFNKDDILGDCEAYAVWVEGIDLEVNIKRPVCGTEVTNDITWYSVSQTNGPEITVPEGAPYYNGSIMGSYWTDYAPRPDTYETPFEGTIQGGKDYYTQTSFTINDGTNPFAGIDSLQVTGSGFDDYSISRSYTNDSISYYSDKVGGMVYSSADVALTVKAVHAMGEDAEVTKEPTCTEQGEKTFTCTVCGEKTIEEIPATGHQWELNKWIWSKDYSQASAEFVCKNDDSHKVTVEANVTSKQTKEPTYTSEGEMLYTAEAVLEGKTHTDTKTVEIPAKEQEEIKLTGIKIEPAAVSMATSSDKAMSTQKLKVTFTPSDATNKELTWTSSDPSVARVDQNGNVTALKYGKVTITATSKENSNIKTICTVQTRFYDVNGNNKSGTADYQYYFDPVYWAATSGITKGYKLDVADGTKVADSVFFGPSRNCTRKEMIIFMWRASNRPSASGSLPFSDTKNLNKNTDTYKAILWGYTNGIIKGYTSGKFKGQFRPDDPVVRKDCLIMLYRLAHKPAVSGKIQFPDVVKMNYKPSSDTYKAILWGVKKGITNGYKDGNFQPMTNCQREHIVTFLWRYKGRPAYKE